MTAPAGFALGFTTLEREVAVDRLPTRGTVPAWLKGTLLRNGPAKFEVGPHRYRHWFDGLAMLHRFSIAGGQVSYNNKFLRSHPYQKAVETGRITYVSSPPTPAAPSSTASTTSSFQSLRTTAWSISAGWPDASWP